MKNNLTVQNKKIINENDAVLHFLQITLMDSCIFFYIQTVPLLSYSL